jgi:hypothetical protein
VFGLADGDARTVRLFDASGAEQVRVEVERAGDRVRATVGSGRPPKGWTLRWVTGPPGEQRGPAVTGTSSELVLHLP